MNHNELIIQKDKEIEAILLREETTVQELNNEIDTYI